MMTMSIVLLACQDEGSPWAAAFLAVGFFVACAVVAVVAILKVRDK